MCIGEAFMKKTRPQRYPHFDENKITKSFIKSCGEKLNKGWNKEVPKEIKEVIDNEPKWEYLNIGSYYFRRELGEDKARYLVWETYQEMYNEHYVPLDNVTVKGNVVKFNEEITYHGRN
jgi:hypothetical protein